MALYVPYVPSAVLKRQRASKGSFYGCSEYDQLSMFSMSHAIIPLACFSMTLFIWWDTEISISLGRVSVKKRSGKWFLS